MQPPAPKGAACPRLPRPPPAPRPPRAHLRDPPALLAIPPTRPPASPPRARLLARGTEPGGGSAPAGRSALTPQREGGTPSPAPAGFFEGVRGEKTTEALLWGEEGRAPPGAPPPPCPPQATPGWVPGAGSPSMLEPLPPGREPRPLPGPVPLPRSSLFVLPARQPPFFKKKRHPPKNRGAPTHPPRLPPGLKPPLTSPSSHPALRGKSRRGGRVVPSWDPVMTALKPNGSDSPPDRTHPPSPRARPRGEAALPAARFAPSGCLPAPRRGCAIPPASGRPPGGSGPAAGSPEGSRGSFPPSPSEWLQPSVPSAPCPLPRAAAPGAGFEGSHRLLFLLSTPPPPPSPRTS